MQKCVTVSGLENKTTKPWVRWVSHSTLSFMLPHAFKLVIIFRKVIRALGLHARRCPALYPRETGQLATFLHLLGKQLPPRELEGNWGIDISK